MIPNIEVLPDMQRVYWRAAEEFSRLALESVGSKGVFNVALSGGSTPKGLYVLLADETHPFRARIPWQRTHFFWGDERNVPADDPQSNYGMVWGTLLSNVPVSPGNIHHIPTELHDAALVAEGYERLIRQHFRLEPGQLPRFDLILLGMGSDGHTASLFPGSSALQETEKMVCAVLEPKGKVDRITFTFPVLNNAENIRFLIVGKDKAEALRKVLSGDSQSETIPAQRVHPVQGNLLWLVDLAAASRLPRDWRSGHDLVKKL